MTKIVLFLGPSLPRDRAEELLDAIYLPPAGQSDLISAVRIYQPDVIGLIDGVFLQRPAVWHKEILYALQQGIAVYGASSMGALRAAELDAFGMVGVGQIYQRYASGELLDDDEVALVYGSAETGYQPLSEPMINLRATFHLAQQQGNLSQDQGDRLIAIAKSIYFPERTLQAVFEQARRAGLPEATLATLQAFVQENYVDLKRQDAELLLQTLRDRTLATPGTGNSLPTAAAVEPTPTHVYATLLDCERQVQRQGVKIPIRRIAENVALHAPNFDQLNFQSLNRMLVQVLAALLQITVEPAAVAREQQRFRCQHGLLQDSDLDQWLQDNDLTVAEFEALMQELALCRRLHHWLLNRQAYQRNLKSLLNELRLQNCYPAWADAAGLQERRLQDHPLDLNAPDYRHQSCQDLLLEHQQATGCQISSSLSDWLLEAGWLSLECLQMELIRAKAARAIAAEPEPSDRPS